jgi:hypothetical protein
VGWRHAAAAVLGGVILIFHIAACEEDCARHDHNACSIDRCVNGAPTHEKMANGAECLLGVKRGVCASGYCVAKCNTVVDCFDGDECTQDECVGGVCVNGLQTPPASGSCQQGVCFQGQPKQIPKLDGTTCGTAGGECDHGVCSQCTQDSDCGQKTACQRWFCDGGTCRGDLTDAGMILPDVIDDDCKWHICDGHGNAIMIAAEGDLPSVDYTSCIEQTCEGWTAVFGPKPAGAQCQMQGGPWGLCDGAGSCVACVKNTDCPDWGDYCFAGNCARCDDGKQNGDETGVDCGNGVCGACLGTPCTAGATCKSGYCQDGMCCNVAMCGVCKTCASQANAGICVDIPADQPDPAGCTATGKACNGSGACKTKNGYPCVSGMDCISNKCTNGICLP